MVLPSLTCQQGKRISFLHGKGQQSAGQIGREISSGPEVPGRHVSREEAKAARIFILSDKVGELRSLGRERQQVIKRYGLTRNHGKISGGPDEKGGRPLLMAGTALERIGRGMRGEHLLLNERIPAAMPALRFGNVHQAGFGKVFLELEMHGRLLIPVDDFAGSRDDMRAMLFRIDNPSFVAGDELTQMK